MLPIEVIDEYYELFDILTAHYLNGRYADYKQKLSGLHNEQTATDLYNKSMEVYAWLLKLKP